MGKIIGIAILTLTLYSFCGKNEELNRNSFQGAPVEKNQNPAPLTKLSEENQRLLAYFQEIALGFEHGSASKVTRKWDQNMKVYVGGIQSAELLNELKKIKREVSQLAKDGFEMEIVSDSLQSNFYLFLGSGEDYAEIFPSQSNYVDSNWGLFHMRYNAKNHFTQGHMYVDIYRTNSLDEQKHLLREELTQALGLARDSDLYEDSIFQSAWTTVTEYSEMDRAMIRFLYHPEMKAGLNHLEVEEILTEILLREQAHQENSAYSG